MATLAVIPARLEAERLPRKPLRLLGGVPLIIRVWERVRSFALADQVVVATESEEVARVIESAGGTAVITSAAHRSGTDRVAEVARMNAYASFDVVVNVQGDEPFIDAAAVDGAVRMVRDHGFPLGTAAVRLPDEDLTGAPQVV